MSLLSSKNAARDSVVFVVVDLACLRVTVQDVVDS